MEPGGPEGGREGAEAKCRVCRRAGEPQRRARPGDQVAGAPRSQPLPYPEQPARAVPSRNTRASGPAIQDSGGRETRWRALREGWWRPGAGQRSRPRLPPGRGRREPELRAGHEAAAPGLRPPRPGPSRATPRPCTPSPAQPLRPGAPPCRGPRRPFTPAFSGSARWCSRSQGSTSAPVEVPPRVKNVC